MNLLAPTPFSYTTEKEGLELLTGDKATTVKRGEFTSGRAEVVDDVLTKELRERHGTQGVEDLFDHLGKELSMRCACQDPELARKKISRRELIFSCAFHCQLVGW